VAPLGPSSGAGTPVALTSVMKTLCATDFSERSEAAVRIAAALTRWSGGSLELVHVLPRPEMGYAALASDSLVLDQEIRQSVRQKLSEVVAGVTDSARLSATAALLEGRPHEAIMSRAKEINADLVVMGAHGGAALDRLILGSVAERTVRHASLPVLIVPPGARAWDPSQDKAPRCSVITALDGRPSSAGPIAFVSRLRAFLPCDVTVLRLYWPYEEYARLGLTGDRELDKADPAVVADLELGLRALVGVLPGDGATTFAIEPTWGEPAARLLDAALARHGDLVVIGAESRHGFARLAHPAVADNMARVASGVPVLFVPGMTPPEPVSRVPRVFTVLAATDLSPVGNRAVPFAYSLLTRGGVVELCHIHERTLPSPAFAYESPVGALDDAHRREIERALRALVPRDAEELGISTHVTIVDGGQSGEAIVQAAERLRVDAIVLGSHGRGGVARAAVGSVSETVLRHTRRPVLVVPVGPPSGFATRD
jgi:nucleotide-binding universal stress UspA family protein